MGAFPGTSVHTADNAVPPLDDDLEGILEDLSGIHPGIDQIRAGFRLLALDRLTRDQTQTIISAIGGSDGADITGLQAAVVARLTDPDTNPCLRELHPDVANDVRRIGGAYAIDLATTAPRDLAAEACIRIDPYAGPQPPMTTR
jgi:hypothetical protein